jgi:tetratricopeptide (TPR) repeat protein
LQGGQSGGAAATGRTAPKEGRPPLALELGVRDDAEAQDLRRGAALYAGGRLTEAAAVFDRYGSTEARIGSAFSRWPDGTLDRLNQLAALSPQSAAVQLHLGLADYWIGDPGAEAAWRSARTLEPDTMYSVTAGNLLFPQFFKGNPIFVTRAPLPDGFRSLSAAAQLDLLGARSTKSVAAALQYGAALQRLGHQVSAERVFRQAAQRAPNDPEAQVAAAVGRFDKAAPAKAFSQLGPLTRRFPHAATVRFHLGLLLLWSGSIKGAEAQFVKAQKAEPGSPLAVEAGKYLKTLTSVGK